MLYTVSGSGGPERLPPEALESRIAKASRSSLLLLAPPGDDLLELAVWMGEEGLTVVWADSAAQASSVAHLPRFAVISPSLPGGLDLVRELAAAPHEVLVLAVLEPDEDDAPAYEAGAVAALRRPIRFAAARALVKRLRDLEASSSVRGERYERELASAIATAVGAFSSALIGELEPPATSLVRAARIAAEPDPDLARAAERVESALARLRDAGRDAVRNVTRVDLGATVASAVSAARRARLPIEVAAEPSIFAFAAEGRLERVLSDLLLRVAEVARPEGSPGLLVRVYATADEARVSIRDRGRGLALALDDGRIRCPSGLRDASPAARELGLSLLLARQAAAAMGGALSLGDGESACVRVRLRLAKPPA